LRSKFIFSQTEKKVAHKAPIPMQFKYISEQGKKNLSNYKYTPADDSLITPILNKYFWEPAVVILPMWMAYVLQYIVNNAIM